MTENKQNNNQDEISQEDIEKLLAGQSSTESSYVEDISKKDIDHLLKGLANNEKPRKFQEKRSDTKPVFVSQNKINQLLKEFEENRSGKQIQADAPGEKAEQIPPEKLKSEISDQVKAVSQNNIESLLSNFEHFRTDKEKTIIKEQPAGKKRFPSKRVVIFSAVTVVIFLSSLFTYIAFNQTPNHTLKQTAERAASDFLLPIPPVPKVIKLNFSVDFKDFIVLTPVSRKDFTFINADVQIDCMNDLTVNEINKHKTFFRFVIYDVLQNELTSSRNISIGLTNLKDSIANALKNSLPAMPEKGIKKVTFKKFDLI